MRLLEDGATPSTAGRRASSTPRPWPARSTRRWTAPRSGPAGVGRRPAGGGAPDRRERRGGAANGPAARGRRLSEPGRRARGRRSGLARCGLPTDSTPPSTSPSSPSACARDDVRLLDVRDNDEWEDGHVAGSQHLLPRPAGRRSADLRNGGKLGRRLLGGPQLDHPDAAQARRRRGRRPRRRRRRRRPRARGREARQRR